LDIFGAQRFNFPERVSAAILEWLSSHELSGVYLVPLVLQNVRFVGAEQLTAAEGGLHVDGTQQGHVRGDAAPAVLNSEDLRLKPEAQRAVSEALKVLAR